MQGRFVVQHERELMQLRIAEALRLDRFDRLLEVDDDPFAHAQGGRLTDPDDLQTVRTGGGDDGTRLRRADIQAGDGLASSHVALPSLAPPYIVGATRDTY